MEILLDQVWNERQRLRKTVGVVSLQLYSEEAWADLIRHHVKRASQPDFEQQMLTVAAVALEALEWLNESELQDTV